MPPSPSLRTIQEFAPWLATSVAWLAPLLVLTTCAAPSDPTWPIETVRAKFPTQAGRVLGEETTVRAGASSISATRVSPLRLSLPSNATDEIRIELEEITLRVVEIGAGGLKKTLASGATAYARAGRATFWTTSATGHEEWLLLERDFDTTEPEFIAGEWEVAGLELRLNNGAVQMFDEKGRHRITVTAPHAFGSRGPLPLRLRVAAGRIQLLVSHEGDRGPFLVDPLWQAAGTMSAPRHTHSATLLPNGKVLVAGGYSVNSAVATAEIYDPSNNTWSSAASMATPRRLHTATLLPNGKVLVAGGFGTTALSAAELFDPATNTWTDVPMAGVRYEHTATLLANGLVLVAGGNNHSTSVPWAELFDSTTNTWSSGGVMTSRRMLHTATVLPNGRVLVVGGLGIGTLASAEFYDPTTNNWTILPSMSTGRRSHTAAPLPGGRVLVIAGSSSTVLVQTAEIFDGTTNTWSNAPPSLAKRASQTSTVLPDGVVLVAGGVFGGPTTADTILATAELYNPTTNSWAQTTGLLSPNTTA